MKTSTPLLLTALTLVAATVGNATAQTQTQAPLLEIETAGGDTVASVRADSARFLVPIALLAGGITFPDGSVQTTAAGGAAHGSAAAADSASDATPATVVARDADGGFEAGPMLVQSSDNTVAVFARNQGDGAAGAFHVLNAASGANAVSAVNAGSGSALFGSNSGTGTALRAYSSGTGSAAHFETDNTTSPTPAVMVETTHSDAGWALWVRSLSNSSPGAMVESRGDAPAAEFRVSTTAAAPANIFRGRVCFSTTTPCQVRYRVATDGTVYANGFDSGGADLAESFAVEGASAAYEPGDVLAISRRTDRTMEKAAEPYSTRVAGVYATQPGMLLSEHGTDGPPDDEVPVGVVGVVPTKVTVEGGPIRRGDLIVTSSTPGHAMRADPERLGFGMVLGKALEPYDGPDAGMIRVLVNVK